MLESPKPHAHVVQAIPAHAQVDRRGLWPGLVLGLVAEHSRLRARQSRRARRRRPASWRGAASEAAGGDRTLWLGLGLRLGVPGIIIIENHDRRIAMHRGAALNLYDTVVASDWVDYNGHMNDAAYGWCSAARPTP